MNLLMICIIRFEEAVLRATGNDERQANQNTSTQMVDKVSHHYFYELAKPIPSVIFKDNLFIDE